MNSEEDSLPSVYLDEWHIAAYDVFIEAINQHKEGLLNQNAQGALDVDLTSTDTLFEELTDSILEISSGLWIELSKQRTSDGLFFKYSYDDRIELVKHYTHLIVETLFSHYGCDYFDPDKFYFTFSDKCLNEFFSPTFEPQIFYFANVEQSIIPAILVLRDTLHLENKYRIVFGFTKPEEIELTANRFPMFQRIIDESDSNLSYVYSPKI